MSRVRLYQYPRLELLGHRIVKGFAILILNTTGERIDAERDTDQDRHLRQRPGGLAEPSQSLVDGILHNLGHYGRVSSLSIWSP